MSRKYSIIITLAFLACSSPGKEESIIVNKLNGKYSDSEFAAAPGPVGTHLNLYLKNARVDSLSLKRLYDSSIQVYSKSDGIPWVYLTVYDSSRRYLFTIVRDREQGHSSLENDVPPIKPATNGNDIKSRINLITSNNVSIGLPSPALSPPRAPRALRDTAPRQ